MSKIGIDFKEKVRLDILLLNNVWKFLKMNDTLQEVASEFDNEFELSQGSTNNQPQENAGTSISVTVKKSSLHNLLVNSKQKGNPLLKAIRKVAWEYDEIVPDYQMGTTTCALFLSLRYHNLNPNYIHERLKLLSKMYELRVLLVQVDMNDPHHLIKNLTRICILADMTLILAWNAEEAGRIIETYKLYENKPPDNIMFKSETSPYLQMVQALTSIKPINKTDALTLLTRFKTLKGIIEATEYQLSECVGVGPRKARKLYAVLHESFCK